MSASSDRRRHATVFGVVFGLVFLAQAVVLYAAFFPAPHNGGDNAGYLTLAHSLLERGAYLELWDPEEPPHTKYPPVFPLILAFAMVLGASSWTAFKAMSLAFTSAAVLLTFAWVRERRGLAFAAAVAMLLVLSDALLWSSFWILSEPPFLALTLLALWSFQRVTDAPAGSATRWLWIGCAAAILAYFTRSAGIPLVTAVALWMAGHRRWRPLALFLAAFGVPVFLWWLRTRTLGDSSYVAEFWMVDPYDPRAGRAGPGDLFARVVQNFHLYVGTYLPRGIIGLQMPLFSTLGYVFFLSAAVGWFRRYRREATVAEIFFPLYVGLILLWPVVWSGDRFALPLFPLLLFYAGDALLDGARAFAARILEIGRSDPDDPIDPLAPRDTLAPRDSLAPRDPRDPRGWSARAGIVSGAVLFLVVAAPALWSWTSAVGRASECAAVQELLADDPFACYAGPTGEFVAAARWSGENLPEEAVVFSRKPRLFHVLSGVRSRMYPLSADPEVFVDAAREGEIGYVLVDFLDNVGSTYLFPVIRERPELFCGISAWGRAGEVQTQLLGVTLPEVQGAGGAEGEPPEEGEEEEIVRPDGMVELSIPPCGDEFLRDEPLPPSLPLERVPLLDRERRRGPAQSSPSP